MRRKITAALITLKKQEKLSSRYALIRVCWMVKKLLKPSDHTTFLMGLHTIVFVLSNDASFRQPLTNFVEVRNFNVKVLFYHFVMMQHHECIRGLTWFPIIPIWIIIPSLYDLYASMSSRMVRWWIKQNSHFKHTDTFSTQTLLLYSSIRPYIAL